MTAVSYSSANSVSFLNRCLRFILFSRLIHVLYVNGWIAGSCFYLGNELQQQYRDVHLREKTYSSPRKGKVEKMYFLFDILLARADQKETCDLQLVYVNFIFLCLSGFSLRYVFFASEMKQILITVPILIWK